MKDCLSAARQSHSKSYVPTLCKSILPQWYTVTVQPRGEVEQTTSSRRRRWNRRGKLCPFFTPAKLNDLCRLNFNGFEERMPEKKIHFSLFQNRPSGGLFRRLLKQGRMQHGWIAKGSGIGELSPPLTRQRMTVMSYCIDEWKEEKALQTNPLTASNTAPSSARVSRSMMT